MVTRHRPARHVGSAGTQGRTDREAGILSAVLVEDWRRYCIPEYEGNVRIFFCWVTLRKQIFKFDAESCMYSHSLGRVCN